MLKMNLYIHSAASITAEPDADVAVERLVCKEPNYTGIIPPMQLRRMSKAVRIGIACAKECMENVGIVKPDAIITGTGLGCLQDTENFLTKMIVQEEQMLTPTAFIQSTHNTVAGQIALMTECTGYNNTISQQGASFEGALMAAQMYLSENNGHQILIGGVDEMTATSFKLLQRARVYAAEHIAPNNLITTKRKGTLAGEGAAFFVVSDNEKGALMRITQMVITEDSNEAIVGVESAMKDFGQGDMVLLGRNGDERVDEWYARIEATHPAVDIRYFKDKCGDYPTVISAGVAQALKLLPERAIIVNHWCGLYSCVVVEPVGVDWALVMS